MFTRERLDVIEYVAMIGSTAIRFVFRAPPLPYLSNIFTLPFTGTVWLAVLISILGCALFLYIAARWEASISTVSVLGCWQPLTKHYILL